MKLIIVDDDPMVCDSFEIILSSEADFDVIGTAHNGKEAIEFVEGREVDLILMDIAMPVMTGIEATRILKRKHPELKIVMLTTFLDYRNIHQSLQAGADGYLLKSDDSQKQIDTIRMIKEGHAVLSPRALKKLTDRQAMEELTPRENDILELVAQGLTNKEIAATLYMSEGTIRNMISIILDKLELRDRTQLAIYYWQHRT
ncbi:MAG: response regulator [Acholeplasmataceae bacterium]